jgi:hypothetical protein
MSSKRSVPVLRLLVTGEQGHPQWLEGPVVSPDKTTAATDLSTLHEILAVHGACLLYEKRWWYVARHAVHRAAGGGSRFDLPWPLGEADHSSPAPKRCP